MAGHCFYVESLQSWIVTKPTVMYGRALFLCRVLTELDCYQANSGCMAGYCFYVESLQSWIVTKPTVMYGRILFLYRVLTELDCYQANSDVWQDIVSM